MDFVQWRPIWRYSEYSLLSLAYKSKMTIDCHRMRGIEIMYSWVSNDDDYHCNSCGHSLSCMHLLYVLVSFFQIVNGCNGWFMYYNKQRQICFGIGKATRYKWLEPDLFINEIPNILYSCRKEKLISNKLLIFTNTLAVFEALDLFGTAILNWSYANATRLDSQQWYRFPFHQCHCKPV